MINEQLKGTQNDIKNNVKNMIDNIQNINEMKNKSAFIKYTSFQFRGDSLAIENKMISEKKIVIILAIIFIWKHLIFNNFI